MPNLTIITTNLQPNWNLLADVKQLLAFHFMQNAFLAGTMIALLAGAVGYFMVLRGQSFAGHTLAHLGFAGAAGAGLIGWSPVGGLLIFCIGAALGIDLLGGRHTKTQWGHDVAIATIQTFALGLGLLFTQISTTYTAGIYAILFGSVLGISDQDVSIITVTTVVTLVGLLVIARPLLFASIEPDIAEARGVPVSLLSKAFLILLAFAVAQAVQVVGVLLIFALLVTPAATAQLLTARPGIGIWLAILLSLLFTWAGLTFAYFTAYPVGFCVTSLAFGTYGLVRLISILARRQRLVL